MADLKTTKEERARIHQRASDTRALDIVDLLDDLDTLEAENAALREVMKRYVEVDNAARRVVMASDAHLRRAAMQRLTRALEALEEP